MKKKTSRVQRKTKSGDKTESRSVRARLERLTREAGLGAKRNKEAAERKFRAQLKRMPRMVRAMQGCTILLDHYHLLMTILAGHINHYNAHFNPRYIKDDLEQLLEFRLAWTYEYFRVKNPFDPKLSDRENLLLHRQCVQAFRDDADAVERMEELGRAHADFLKMLGQLARRINSAQLPRIVRCIVDARDVFSAIFPRSHEEAVRLAEEICQCWDSVQLEVELLDERERADLNYPEIPRHDPEMFDEDSCISRDMSPDEATQLSREMAVEQYKKYNFEFLPQPKTVMLMQGVGTSEKGDVCPMVPIRDRVAQITEAMEKGEPTFDRHYDHFDYPFLGRILEANFNLTYRDYYLDGDDDGCALAHHRCWEETDEAKIQKEIIGLLQRYMNAALTFANSIESSSIEKWKKMIALFEKYGGCFRGIYDEDRDEAKADVREFLSLMRQARLGLWTDNESVKKAGGVRHQTVKLSQETHRRIDAGRQEQLAPIAANVQIIADSSKPAPKSRDDLIDIVRRVKKDGLEGKIPGVSSIPTAIKYLRKSLTPNQPYYHESLWANDFVAGYAANKKTKKKGGIESVWASIRRQCSTRRTKPKRESLAPSPILSKGL